MKISPVNFNFNTKNYKKPYSYKETSSLSNTCKKEKTSSLDSFIRSDAEKVLSNSNTKMLNGRVANDLLDVLNFEGPLPCTNDIYTYKDISFTANQIPKVDSSNCKEIKACNNVVTFERNSYYKYSTKDGKSHCLATYGDHLNTPWSDVISGNADDISYMTSRFWNILSGKSSVYISLDFSQEKQKQYLKDAGINKGFFTVNMGGKSEEHYYSEGDTIIHPKWEYDEQYPAITSQGGLFSEEKPGDTFLVDGKEYVLSDKHTLDVPYGADIFNIKYPHMLKNESD